MIRSAYGKRLSVGMMGVVLLATTVIGCAGGPLSTREKAAGIGTLGGAAAEVSLVPLLVTLRPGLPLVVVSG